MTRQLCLWKLRYSSLKRLTVSLPKIAFLQGEYERSIDKLGPRDYGAISNDITFRYALINQVLM